MEKNQRAKLLAKLVNEFKIFFVNNCKYTESTEDMSSDLPTYSLPFKFIQQQFAKILLHQNLWYSNTVKPNSTYVLYVQYNERLKFHKF